MRRYSVEDCVRKIRSLDKEINAVLHLCLDEARKKSKERKKEKPRSPLHGVPYTLKDVWDTARIPSTGGSFRYRNRVPEKSGLIHSVFEKLGAVLLGKSNVGDLALSPESDNYLIGATKNPHDPSCTAGGSTGGGAAAVAAGMAAFDWGSDMGGSIRNPAANCGVVGLRLSSSSWPHEGHFPPIPPDLYFLNGMGPVTRTLSDCRTLLRATAPYFKKGKDFPFRLKGILLYGPDRWSRGEWPHFSRELVSPLKEAGFLIHGGTGLPSPWQVNNLYNAFLASNLDKFLVTGTFGFWGALTSVLSALTIGPWIRDRRLHPLTAQTLALLAIGKLTIHRDAPLYWRKVRELRKKVEEVWEEGYLIVTPTTTYPAPKHGKVLLTWSFLNFVKFGNLVDATALAFPWGKFSGGMPRSLQIMGPPGSEEILLDVAERLSHTVAI